MKSIIKLLITDYKKQTKEGHPPPFVGKCIKVKILGLFWVTYRTCNYKIETSEQISELEGLFKLGHEVFDNEESFNDWLITPSRTLDNKPPYELLCDSSSNFEMVKNEIIRIKYNVYI